MANKYIIIGRSSCPYCQHAIDYCAAKNTEYTFLDYEEETIALEEYKTFYSQDTVPIILSNNITTGTVKVVGGYTDLLEHLV